MTPLLLDGVGIAKYYCFYGTGRESKAEEGTTPYRRSDSMTGRDLNPAALSCDDTRLSITSIISAHGQTIRPTSQEEAQAL